MRNLGNCISSNFSEPGTGKECFHQETVIGTLEIGSEALPRNCFLGNGSKYRRQKTLTESTTVWTRKRISRDKLMSSDRCILLDSGEVLPKIAAGKQFFHKFSFSETKSLFRPISFS